MKDMSMMIYDLLKTNPTIKTMVEGRIKFYEWPGTEKYPAIIIRPLDVPSPGISGSNKQLTTKFLYQVDVETNKRFDAKIIQGAVKDEMKLLGFGQLNEGLDTYFPETKRFIDARRYQLQTKLYDTNY